ncbi:hypothetical protein ABFS82_03G077300 [Erythranthe guttata]
MAMMKVSFVLSLILLSFVTGGKCSEVDCAKVPIENLEPCKAFVLGESNGPSVECCKGVKSWTTVSEEIVCECYRKAPQRLSYKPDQIRATTLPFVCRVPEFYNYIACLVAN